MGFQLPTSTGFHAGFQPSTVVRPAISGGGTLGGGVSWLTSHGHSTGLHVINVIHQIMNTPHLEDGIPGRTDTWLITMVIVRKFNKNPRIFHDSITILYQEGNLFKAKLGWLEEIVPKTSGSCTSWLQKLLIWAIFVWNITISKNSEMSLPRGSSQDGRKWLITMVIVSPLSRVVGPLPNGLSMAYEWGFLITY